MGRPLKDQEWDMSKDMHCLDNRRRESALVYSLSGGTYFAVYHPHHAGVWVTALLRIRLKGQKLAPFFFPTAELKKICCARLIVPTSHSAGKSLGIGSAATTTLSY